jgi:hypothetical protein
MSEVNETKKQWVFEQQTLITDEEANQIGELGGEGDEAFSPPDAWGAEQQEKQHKEISYEGNTPKEQ